MVAAVAGQGEGSFRVFGSAAIQSCSWHLELCRGANRPQRRKTPTLIFEMGRHPWGRAAPQEERQRHQDDAPVRPVPIDLLGSPHFHPRVPVDCREGSNCGTDSPAKH